MVSTTPRIEIAVIRFDPDKGRYVLRREQSQHDRAWYDTGEPKRDYSVPDIASGVVHTVFAGESD